MTPIISTWVFIFSLNGGAASYPNHTVVINDMPSLEECRRVGHEIVNRFNVSKSLCLEVKKVKP